MASTAQNVVSDEEIDKFIKKCTFLYITAPPIVNKDHEHYIKLMKKDNEKKPERKKLVNKKLSIAYAQFGRKGLNWLRSLDIVTRQTILSDTMIMHGLSIMEGKTDRQRMIDLLSPAVQEYGGFEA